MKLKGSKILENLRYANQFTCIPDIAIFRPSRSTPRPVIHGPQPATVVGPAGEEIHSDEFGRIKVQFFWDREGRSDENSSGWIRVAQPQTDGSILLPRIGWEVLVDFQDGDPDRPLVIGRVYNAGDLLPRSE